MTDGEALLAFRIKEAGETLSDAERMLAKLPVFPSVSRHW